MSIGIWGSGNEVRAGHISLLRPDITSRLADQAERKRVGVLAENVSRVR